MTEQINVKTSFEDLNAGLDVTLSKLKQIQAIEYDRMYVVEALTKLLATLQEGPGSSSSHSELLTAVRKKLTEVVSNL